MVAGLCYFIDKIATAEFRIHVASLLARHSATIEKVTVAEHVQRYIAGTVGHYFGGEFFSWRNVGRSFFLTLFALLVIIPLTCALNRKTPAEIFTIWGELDSRHNIAMIAFLFGACLLIDMLSFLQTAMFMRLTAYVPRLRDMVAMAFFDIVVTLNLFSMLFAALLVPVVFYIDQRGTPMEISARDTGSVSSKRGSGKESSMEVLRANGLSINGIEYLAKRPGDQKWNAYETGYVALKGYTAEEVVRSFMMSAGASPGTIVEAVANRESDTRETRSTTATIETWGLHRRLNFMLLYQIVYTRSHVVQDAFLGLLKLDLLAIDTSALFSISEEYSATPLKYDRPFFSLCDGQVRYEASVESRPTCEKYAVLEVGTPLTRLYTWLMAVKPEVKPFPITVIAASSLFLTMAFYMGLAVYSAIAFAARHASGFMLSNKYLDLEVAPLTIGAIYAMLCLLLGYLLP